jgi:membrane protease YdiL (CAAX protease family)
LRVFDAGFREFSETQMVPLLMTSIIFGSVHFGNPEVSKLGYYVCVYITGLFLGDMTLMDEEWS